MPCHHTDTTGTTYIFYVYTLEITKGKNNKKAGSKETTQRDTGEGKIKEYMSCLPQEMWYRQKKNERETTPLHTAVNTYRQRKTKSQGK